MSLDIFDIKLGKDAVMPRLDADATGIVAVKVLDAIQTVVNVLTDNDGKGGWTVGFDPTVNAYTDRSARRQIVVSVKPLMDAKPGDSLVNVTKVMTGFAVHEVGHTKLNFYEAIVARWPGKQLPIVLGNIIEDVVLEMRTVERYRGFADNGEGNIFRPTLEWVAELTCPKTPLKWSGSTGHKVNMVGQIVRYRDFVTFDTDATTQAALNFVEQWATGITSDLTPSGCVTLIEALLDYIHTSEPEAPETPEPPPPTTECDFPFGEPPTPTIPNEDDDETEPPTGSGTEPGTEPGEGNPEGGDGDADGDGDDDGGTEGGGDSDDDGETDGGDDTEGGDDTDGGSDGPSRTDGNDADHGNRTESDKGTNDQHGAGGSGQSVSEADPDAGFDEADLTPTFDDVAKPDEATYQQQYVARAEAEERVTTRVDAGAFGTMKVVFK